MGPPRRGDHPRAGLPIDRASAGSRCLVPATARSPWAGMPH